jgi:general secretion pathway protein D
MLVAAMGCATGQALSKADDASKRGDWDSAVLYYRQALTRDPKRVETKIALQEATHKASSAHVDRAKQLEAQEQLSGAASEYRMAADLDPANTYAAAKALEIERKMRDQIEATRGKSKMDEMRAQAIYEPPVLDPRVNIPLLQFAAGTAVRDILTSIGAITGINIMYDQAGGSTLDPILSRPTLAINMKDVKLDYALNQLLSTNGLFYKVIDPKSILVAVDNPQTRQGLEDQAVQTFYISNMDATELSNTLTQLLSQITLAIRPQPFPNKTNNTITVRANLPTLEVIGKIIKAMDKPRAEIMVDVEVLEVDKTRIKNLGINLSNYALGLTFSPEAAPPNTGTGTTGPVQPSAPAPFNLNTVSNGVNTTNFYLTVPTALMQLMEQDSGTKILAHPQLRGAEGQTLSLKIGSKIPVAATTFSSLAAGGAATLPSVSYQYQDVGVNVTLTNPRVTYDNEIVLTLQVVNSALGQNITVAGSAIPEFTNREVDTVLRLRDGESNLIAGLLLDQDTNSANGFPGVSQIPILRSIFGSSQDTVNQTDIVMMITPRIVRTHELSVEDLKPIYVGTQRNFGLTGPPPLIAPPDMPPVVNPAAPAAASITSVPVPTASTTATGQPSSPPAATSKTPGVVPVMPVTPAAPAPTPPVPQPTGPAQVVLTPPGTVFQMADGARPVPIQISGVAQLGSITLTLTYNPSVLKAEAATLGDVMKQGGATPAFTPKIDAAAGRVDILIARTGDGTGATVPVGIPALLAAVNFVPVAPGSTPITLSGIAMTPGGKPISLQLVSTTVTVK